MYDDFKANTTKGEKIIMHVYKNVSFYVISGYTSKTNFGICFENVFNL